MASSYDYGDLVRVTGTFTDIDGTAADPTAVYFKYTDPSSNITTLTYGVDETLYKSGTGVYYAEINCDESGVWCYRFYSTGTGQAADEECFIVGPSEFD